MFKTIRLCTLHNFVVNKERYAFYPFKFSIQNQKVLNKFDYFAIETRDYPIINLLERFIGNIMNLSVFITFYQRIINYRYIYTRVLHKKHEFANRLVQLKLEPTNGQSTICYIYLLPCLATHFYPEQNGYEKQTSRDDFDAHVTYCYICYTNPPQPKVISIRFVAYAGYDNRNSRRNIGGNIYCIIMYDGALRYKVFTTINLQKLKPKANW